MRNAEGTINSIPQGFISQIVNSINNNGNIKLDKEEVIKFENEGKCSSELLNLLNVGNKVLKKNIIDGCEWIRIKLNNQFFQYCFPLLVN